MLLQASAAGVGSRVSEGAVAQLGAGGQSNGAGGVEAAATCPPLPHRPLQPPQHCHGHHAHPLLAVCLRFCHRYVCPHTARIFCQA